jgi:hypothetical protein
LRCVAQLRAAAVPITIVVAAAAAVIVRSVIRAAAACCLLKLLEACCSRKWVEQLAAAEKECEHMQKKTSATKISAQGQSYLCLLE